MLAQKPEVGQTVLWKQTEWLVFADDSHNDSRNTAFPHWDYILQKVGTTERVKVVTVRDSDHPDMILDFMKVGD